MANNHQPLLRTNSMNRGRAIDVQAARRDRILSVNRSFMCKILCPILTVVIAFVTVCSIYVFSVDHSALKRENSGVYFSGIFLQICFLLIVLRDIAIALVTMKLDARDGVLQAAAAHCACALIDILVLIALVTWATIAISTDSIEEYEALPAETGAADFVKATRANIIVGWLYLSFHCCVPCIVALLCACFSGRIDVLRP